MLLSNIASWKKPVKHLSTVAMEFINLETTSLGMINAIETFSSVFNLYLSTLYWAPTMYGLAARVFNLLILGH